MQSHELQQSMYISIDTLGMHHPFAPHSHLHGHGAAELNNNNIDESVTTLYIPKYA